MTKRIFLSIAASGILIAVSTGLKADTLVANQPLKIKDKAAQKVYAFDLADVKLLESPFKTAMDLDAQYLLSLEPDRLLSRYREFAGLEPKAAAYGGWETATISGHTLGHYLTAVSKLYASTKDKKLLKRIDYIIDELAQSQNAWGNGFVGAFPKSQEVFAEIKAGDIRSAGFDLNGIWVPWYNLHKLYMGLVDVRLYCGNKKAEVILLKSTDWAWDMVGGLSDEQFEQMLHCEHGGVNEAFAEIYALTGSEKALKLARKFYHHRVLDPLARREDRLTGLHSNTQIPKLIGLARLYRLTGEQHYNIASAFFWKTIVENRTYVNGGNTDGEYFFPPDEFSRHLSVHTTETCNTYNMLKLTRQLFAMDPACRYADYYERALYNHILASQDPEQGMMIYFCPLKAGHFKTYNSPFDSFWCCTGTGMENHVKYGDSIYFYDDSTLYVNLFIASVLNFHQKKLTLTQQTRYPLNGAVQFNVDCAKPVKLVFKIRRPKWATEEPRLKINKEPYLTTAAPGNYITVDRLWRKGDQIDLFLPMKLRTECMPDDPRKGAFFYGPTLLAGQLGKEGIEDIDPYARQRAKYDHTPTPPMPVIVADSGAIDNYIKPAGRIANFTIDSAVLRTLGRPDQADITLIPFYRMHHQRYIVYWDIFTPEQWRQTKEQFEADKALADALEDATIDCFIPGQMQPERDHNFKGEGTERGIHLNRSWRDARSGGFFSFEMKVLPDTPVQLACLYWGSDGPGRDFDILIDGHKIATEHLNQNYPGRFFTATYDIPGELMREKRNVTVKFQAHQYRMAGGLFECRTIKAQ
ncbi:MAG: glycoside hydrolase family 127 protein [Sedimentisphaerales bacterium]|nr:glycoside hydrolase family 127 protein [Sedimentisphaerales bacterium]